MKYSRVIALLSALFLLVTGAGIAYADEVKADGDTVSASGTGVNVTVTGSRCLGYVSEGMAYVKFNGSDHFADGASVTVVVDPETAADSVGITATGGTYTMPNPWQANSPDHGLPLSVRVPSSVPDGGYTVWVTVSGAEEDSGTYTQSDKFEVHVKCNPTVAVTGVSNGATYTKGSVPAAGCQVTDPRLATQPSLAPTLSTPSLGGGLGSQTATCTYTTATSNTVATATYTIAAPATAPDSTPPTIEWSGPPTSPWYSSPQTASWTCSDSESTATGSGSGSGGTINASCTSAGGTTLGSQTYKVDTSGPTINWNPPSTDPWYATAPSANWTCSDAESGATGAGTLAAGSDGKLTATCTNGAGTTTSDTKTYKIDSTAPSVDCGSAGAGWHADNVTITCTASDLQSGLVGSGTLSLSTTVAAGSETVDASTTSQQVCDTVGNCASAGPISGNKIDRKGPSVTVSLASAADGNGGWYKTAPSYTVTATDGGSGLGTCDPDGTYSDGDGVDLKVGPKGCTDAVGNPGSASSESFKLDSKAPSVTVGLSAPDGTNGWYKTAPSFIVSGSDTGGSGIASCDAGGTYSGVQGENLTTDSKSCTDNAGNVGQASSSPFKLDSTAPSVSLLGAPTGSYYYGDTITVPTCTASDLLSGLNGSCTVDGFSTAVGTHSLSASATDNAGNVGSTGTSPSTYTVKAWTLNGFYRPVDMGAIVNTVKAGSTVPLKFNIYAAEEIKEPAAVKGFTALSLSCANLADLPTDAIETVATGATILRYDTTGGQFVYNWQTSKATNTCWKVTMTTQDGSKISANFKLK